MAQIFEDIENYKRFCKVMGFSKNDPMALKIFCTIK